MHDFSRQPDHLFRWVQFAPGGTLFFRLSIAFQHDADVQRWGRNLLFSKTEEDLRAIGSVYPLSGHYRLENDISLTQEWTPIGSPSHPFTGSFDGNGYTISHLTVTKEAEHMGFFGASDGANIQNILLSDVALPETVFFPIVSESVDSDIVNCSISYAS